MSGVLAFSRAAAGRERERCGPAVTRQPIMSRVADIPRVLVIDDEEVMLESCRRILTRKGLAVDIEADGLRGRERALGGGYDLVLLDVRLPEIDGLDLLADVRKHRTDLEFIIITGYSTIDAAVKAVKLGAFDYLPKPFTPDELWTRVDAALACLFDRRARQAPASGAIGQRLIGDSEAMARVRALIAQVAPTDATVLIIGESGTGKELAALEIHAASLRRDRPLVSLDCSTLAPGLLESELFGHVKGSFTGAVATKPGLFEIADHATLFLDEVSSLSLETQGKLLRVLETGEIKPVGGVASRHVDIRLITATNRDLADLVKEKAFREDLYYRLNVVPLRLPPLRERPSDVPQLLRHFLASRCRPDGRGLRGFSADAMQRLAERPWPGNVRELRNLVERLMVTTTGEEIAAADLVDDTGASENAERLPIPRTNEELKTLKRRLHERASGELERAFVLDALRRNEWNVSRAARDTGMLRPNFHALMRKYHIRTE
jgi:two-component system, NtrC family, response regulator PilR